MNNLKYCQTLESTIFLKTMIMLVTIEGINPNKVPNAMAVNIARKKLLSPTCCQL